MGSYSEMLLEMLFLFKAPAGEMTNQEGSIKVM